MTSILFSNFKTPALRFCFWIFGVMLITASCTGSRKLMKDAQTLEKGGLKKEAFEMYDLIYSGYANADARVGMKRVAQQMLTDKMQKAQMLCMSENYDAALDGYQEALSFLQTWQSLELTSADNLKEAYAECKKNYIETLYTKAEAYVRDDDFENAHIYIRRIFFLDRNNQKAQYLDMMCDILPNYSAGNIAFERGLFRDAYVYYNEVCKIDAGYKDALKRRDEALANGAFSLAYIMADNKTIPNSKEEALAATIKGKLLDAENPFLELLERDDLDLIFMEQQETLSPEFEYETGAEAGKLKRARFILSGELINLSFEQTPETKSKCDCYATYRINSDKVNCFQLNQTESLKASFKYKLVDAETGKLYKSDVISYSETDTGKNYRYEIMKKISLTSPTGTREHDVNLSNLTNPEIDPLLTEQEMLSKMNLFFAVKIAASMDSFRP